MTVEELVTRALKITGIQSSYENLDPNDLNDCIFQLNGIYDEWSIDKLRSFGQSTTTFTLSAGKDTYTIGEVASDVDAQRPVRIEQMVVHENANDYEIKGISFDRYNSIFNKDVSTYYPRYFYYNPINYFEGEIKFYPTPSKANDVTITQWQLFGGYTSATNEVELPPGYSELLTYKLAVEICPLFGKEVPRKIEQKLGALNDSVDALNAVQWMEEITTQTPSSYRGFDNFGRTHIPTNF